MNWWKSLETSIISGSVKMLFLCGLAVLITGCGGSSSKSPEASSVTVTFKGATPSAVATKVGNEAFTRASLAGNTLNFTIPAGTTNYTVAYVCPSSNAQFFSDSVSEFVFEASIQDGTAFAGNCPNFSAVAAQAATGVVDASAISGATQVLIFGSGSGLLASSAECVG